jgi:hypothetical protein
MKPIARQRRRILAISLCSLAVCIVACSLDIATRRSGYIVRSGNIVLGAKRGELFLAAMGTPRGSLQVSWKPPPSGFSIIREDGGKDEWLLLWWPLFSPATIGPPLKGVRLSLFFVIVAANVVTGWSSWRLHRIRVSLAGCCRDCGYDLRGNVSGACPECGASCHADRDCRD